MLINTPAQLREKAQGLKTEAARLRAQATAQEKQADALEQEAAAQEAWLAQAQPFAQMADQAQKAFAQFFALWQNPRQ